MRNEPINQISPKGLKVWRLYGVMHSAIIWLYGDRYWRFKLVAGRPTVGMGYLCCASTTIYIRICLFISQIKMV